MKEPRPEPERRRDALCVADPRANAIELVLVLSGRRDIGRDREVVARTDRSEQRPERFLVQGVFDSGLPTLGLARDLPERISLVRSLASWTLGWSKGLMPRSRPPPRSRTPSGTSPRPGPARPRLRSSADGCPACLERRELAAPHLPPAGAPDSRRRSGRRRTPRAARDGSPSTGRMPLPSLPVDSAISCSSHMPKRSTGAPDGEGQLVAPREGERRRSPRRAAGPGCPPAPLARQARPSPRARRSISPTSTPASAAGTRPKFESAEYRPPICGSPGKIRRTLRRVASFSRAEPGSVMTTKRSPALAPSSSSARPKK